MSDKMYYYLYAKIIFFCFIFAGFAQTAQAQQKLITSTGDIYDISIVRYGESQLVYTTGQTSQQNTISFDDVMMLVFEDGTTDVFNRADRNVSRPEGALAVQQASPAKQTSAEAIEPANDKGAAVLEGTELNWLEEQSAIILIDGERYPVTANEKRLITLPEGEQVENDDEAMSLIMGELPELYSHLLTVQIPETNYTAEAYFVRYDLENSILAVWLEGDEVKVEFGAQGELDIDDIQAASARANSASPAPEAGDTSIITDSPAQTASAPQDRKLSYGIGAGLNYATLLGDQSENIDGIWGINIGAALWYEFANGITLETGYYLSQKGGSETIEDFGFSSTLRLNMIYLDIPILYNYKLRNYPVTLIGGLNTSILATATYSEADTDLTGRFKRFDMGLTLGTRYEITQTIQMQLFYTLGLANINSVYSTDLKNGHSVLSYGLLYTF